MYIARPAYLRRLIAYKDKDIVKIITGVRRCGKSVLLNELYYDWLLSQGIKADHIIRISLDLKKWESLRDSDNLYEYIKKQIKDDSRYYLFIDEVQIADSFEEVVNSIKNEFNTDVYITGSNSRLLSSDINTIFRGRGIEIRVFPLSFSEYLSFRNCDRQIAFNEYMLYGGFPYAATETDNREKARYLEMLCNTLITKDMIDRYKIRNTELFEAVCDLLCSQIGAPVSSSKIANTLKSNGFKTVDNETISRYLSYMCDAFLFYKVRRYDMKGKEYLKTLGKYYVVDTGIRNAKLNYRQDEPSHLLENIIYLELIRRGYVVDIGKNNEHEIDFVANSLTGDKFYIQVTISLALDEVRRRELSAFDNIPDGYKRIVITLDCDPFKQTESGYKKLNAIDFLLDSNALEKA